MGQMLVTRIISILINKNIQSLLYVPMVGIPTFKPLPTALLALAVHPDLCDPPNCDWKRLGLCSEINIVQGSMLTIKQDG